MHVAGDSKSYPCFSVLSFCCQRKLLVNICFWKNILEKKNFQASMTATVFNLFWFILCLHLLSVFVSPPLRIHLVHADFQKIDWEFHVTAFLLRKKKKKGGVGTEQDIWFSRSSPWKIYEVQDITIGDVNKKQSSQVIVLHSYFTGIRGVFPFIASS